MFTHVGTSCHIKEKLHKAHTCAFYLAFYKQISSIKVEHDKNQTSKTIITKPESLSKYL